MSTIRASLRLLALLLASSILLPVCVLIAAVAPIFGTRVHFAVVMFITRWFTKLFGMLCGLRLTIEGQRSAQASVFIGNHFSYFDILIAGAAVGGVFIASHHMRNWPVIGWFARLAGAVFINRTSVRSAAESSRKISHRAAHGVRMIFFPEGGIKTTDGTLTPFRAFLFGAVADSGLVVQPMAIIYHHLGKEPITAANYQQVYWMHSPLLSHGFRALGLPSIHVRLRFLEPEEPPAAADKEMLREYAERMRLRVIAGLDGALGYAEPGPDQNRILAPRRATK